MNLAIHTYGTEILEVLNNYFVSRGFPRTTELTFAFIVQKATNVVPDGNQCRISGQCTSDTTYSKNTASFT